MKELKLTPNPEHSVEADKAGIAGSSQRIARYICPITGLEMNGRYRLVTCQWDQTYLYDYIMFFFFSKHISGCIQPIGHEMLS